MRIWLYCICRNEAKLMPYFLRHYSTFVDRMTFFDGKSDDGTREMIAANPRAILQDWSGSDALCDDEFLAFANEKWKEARGQAEWIIWVDADEFLYHPDITAVLQRYLEQGVDLPKIAGFTMMSDRLPTTTGQIYDEIKTGFSDDVWSKPCIFRCDIRWNVGRHSVWMEGRPHRYSDQAELKLLHYRCLGIDYLRERHARNWARVPERCRVQTFGENTSPGYLKRYGVKWFEEQYQKLPQMPTVV